MKKNLLSLIVTATIASWIFSGCAAEEEPDLIPNPVYSLEEVGEQLFFDTRLSTPEGQSCASCHDPLVAFVDPDTDFPTSEGIHEGLYGSRNTPTAAYASFIPPMYFDEAQQVYRGGLFWDGRANSLKIQAMGPFLNPLEMANQDELTVIDKVAAADYAHKLKDLFGETIFSQPETAFEAIAEAIAAFEATAAFHPFNSKYDRYLAGEVSLTEEEMLGLAIFEDETKGNCATCHPSRPGEDGTPPLFTDFGYYNLGVPKNMESPYLFLSAEHNPDGEGYIDGGLGTMLNDPAELGKFRTPTLRNIEITGPYMHNGIYTQLKEVVQFYNRRDVEPAKWGPPELATNMNTEDMGDLQLTNAEVNALVAFLITLTDETN